MTQLAPPPGEFLDQFRGCSHDRAPKPAPDPFDPDILQKGEPSEALAPDTLCAVGGIRRFVECGAVIVNQNTGEVLRDIQNRVRDERAAQAAQELADREARALAQRASLGQREVTARPTGWLQRVVSFRLSRAS